MSGDETEKKSNSYYIGKDKIAWLEKQGQAIKRSASYYLDEVLGQLMEAGK